MTILWTSLEASVITGGRSTKDWRATGMCINAAEVQPGDLFFAAPGDNLDEVFMKGAAAAVVASGAEDKGFPLMRVADVYDALSVMARAARFKTHLQVIAVQGQAGRQSLAQTLSSIFEVYTGNRHVSLVLSALPEMGDFAVLGFSPLVKPDIAIVTDCNNVDSSVFEAMPQNGRVIIHADSGNVADVIARARAAGIRNIFTYGRAVDSDAVLVENLPAANGVRVRMRILGEAVDAILPAGAQVNAEMLAGALIMKLSEIPALRIAHALAGENGEVAAESKNLALIDRMLKNPSQAAFKVVNMIDIGNGRRKAILDNITIEPQKTSPFSNKKLEIPMKVDNLELVYACKGVSLFNDADAAVQQTKPFHALGNIVPSVLSPGDYLTFKGVGKGLMGGPKNLISSALRLMPQTGRK
jgi:hypothetical protein